MSGEIVVHTQHRPTGVIQVDVFPDDDISPEHVARDLWATVTRWVDNGILPIIEVTMKDGEIHRVDLAAEQLICKYCHRTIVETDDRWVDPEAAGDDSVWRETCDANHEDRIAAHEPKED